MKRIKKNIISALSVAFAATMFASTLLGNWEKAANPIASAAVPPIRKTEANVKNDVTKYFDSNVVTKLPDTVSSSQQISVIVDMGVDTVMDAYEKTEQTLSLKEYALTQAAKETEKSVDAKRKVLLDKLKKSGIDYTLGEKYDTILSGFEVTIKAADFAAINDLYAGSAEKIIVGEVYEEAVAEQVVTNKVDVYETGIFDSSESTYQGDGVVVAVLDTGLDYTHTAFDPSHCDLSNAVWSLASVSESVKGTVAKNFTAGLTGEDVYVSKKVPYAYDYADKDPDVLPINSEHGTHVAGVIAGKDNVVTGVAPNAQLAIMKVFSDLQSGAKTSWILAALEDCVALGVDVINMSLGSSCGFTREEDRQEINVIYDKIRDAGISLICAASNDYNSTFASEKNGSNPLTRNPDSGTVGAPATYEGALSVASVDGVKTPYLLYDDQIFYFNEASSNDGEDKDFVSEVLSTVGEDVESYDFPFVAIPGIGRSSDYAESGDYYAGKIVLVKRGVISFEDKVRVALKEKGAAGIIIYNNVSGDISMAIGDDIGAACSISQDEGELLAAAGSGIIRISKSQLAGPFMSDFSSWGPTSDLRIKPEITAHGGEILSSVPGQGYDRQSGTSMASPNMAGVAALIRQYVKYSGVFGEFGNTNEDRIAVTELVNQVMMSTADIAYNKNGLPYAVRKQGAGLVNLYKAQQSAAYITTFDQKGNEMSKPKLELGDDKAKAGVYEMKLSVHNISKNTVGYDVKGLVLTEGVSSTYTSHDDTTSTQDGYLLDGAVTEVLSVTGGTQNGNSVTVAAGATATITVKITLSDVDKEYLEKSFENGMYVEGFLTFTPTAGTEVDMSVPFLAFFGDWTEAPIFDEEYYDTHKDEINAGLDVEDKLMADAYATRVVGTMYSDYISYLGTYYFEQDPSTTQIAASKEHIALSNNESGSSSSVNGIYGIFAGLLRNAKRVEISIIEDSNGKVVYEHTVNNVQKSFSQGSSIYASSIDMDFSVLEHDLRNNTKYTVRAEAFIDYEGEQNNDRSVFEFPLYIDYEAPVINGVEYRTEYDKTTKKTKLFADLSIYDNHYAMSVQLGQILPVTDPNSNYLVEMNTFGKYFTPVYSSFNSTSKVTIELTDYVSDIKKSVSMSNDETIVENTNTFVAFCYDYALNATAYEIALPDEVIAMYFTEETININVNETKDLKEFIKIFPEDSWVQTLDFTSSNPEVVDVVNQTLLGKAQGEDVTITATGYDKKGVAITSTVKVHVLAEGETGYSNRFTPPEVNRFIMTGYTTNKAFVEQSSDTRDIGSTGNSYSFGQSTSLSMFPSESVTLKYTLDSYDPANTEVKYESGNEKIVTVDEKGTVVAQSKGSAAVIATVYYNGKKTLNTAIINVTVKDPFSISAIYLNYYKGLGGVVEIPANRGITTISEFAFSNYEYVEKDLSAGDIIDYEDPSTVKQAAIGENTIEKVIIPEGVTHINTSAFEKLTALKEVVLPSTLVNIGNNAFAGCTSLTTINLEHVKFINMNAFKDCALKEVDLSSVVAVGNNAFSGCQLEELLLPATAQSLGEGAFAFNEKLETATFEASKVKIGPSVFEGCIKLRSTNLNAAVISAYAFASCTKLEEVTLGVDVAVIGEFAFAESGLKKFVVADGNVAGFTTKANGKLLYKGTQLVQATPDYKGVSGAVTLGSDTTSIGTGAFAANTGVKSITANSVTEVGAYAFALCSSLTDVQMNAVEEISTYAFYGTALKATPDLSNVKSIGTGAFAYPYTNGEGITEVSIPDGAEIGEYAFYYNPKLTTVMLGNDVKVGDYAFASPVGFSPLEDTLEEESDYLSLGLILSQYYTTYVQSVDGEAHTYYRYNYKLHKETALTTVRIGNNCELGMSAFDSNLYLTTVELGDNATIGDFAFYNAVELKTIDLSKVKSIGKYAFAGERLNEFEYVDGTLNYAFKYDVIDGESVPVDYKYTSFAPAIESVDLRGVKTEGALGEAAFANNAALTSILFATETEGFTAIPAYAFINCESLTALTLPAYITEIGEYAFSSTALSKMDLSHVDVLGEYAFSYSALKEVTLKEGTEIADGTFSSCLDLEKVENLQKAVKIGANAFRGVALTSADLSAATSIGDFAFSQSLLESVTLGEGLQSLGNNPFYGCAIDSFVKEVDVVFNDKVVGKEESDTYALSEGVKVYGGVLYQVLANGGMELICYPLNKTETGYTVEEGTVKIGERAFEGASLRYVLLPMSLEAIGDKAFYQCSDLATVEFRSLYAPMLEEAFDENYMSYENLSLTGKYGEYEGLGIVPFTNQWDINQTTFFYGANFVDYIGHHKNKLVMIKPANGLQYDSFIYGQYFAAAIDGNETPVAALKDVVALIEKLPENVTLANEKEVEAALKAYEALASAQQGLIEQKLVEKLNGAVSMIEYLKRQQEEENNSGTDTPPDLPSTNDGKGLPGWAIALIVVGGVLVLAGVAGGVYVFLAKKGVVKAFWRKEESTTEESQTTEENSQEE